MKIHKILLHNLHSLRHPVEIDFDANPLATSGLFAITGDTGAGKTTILDALTLATYGEICRGGKAHEALSYGANEGYAECVFEAKGRRFLAKWHIRRTKSKKENNTEIMREVGEWDAEKNEFVIRAARKVTEVDDFIKKVTGLDFQQFTRSVLLAQGDFASFLKAPHRERSELLERITGTGIYTELSRNAFHRASIEEEALLNLRNRQKALHVLTKDELAEIKTQLEQAETDSRSLNLRRAETAKALQIRQQIAQLEARQREVAAQIEILAAEKNEAATDLEWLEMHRKTLPFHAQLHRLDEKNAEILTAGQAATRLETELSSLQIQAENAGQLLRETEANHLAIKALQPEKQQLFEQATALDAAISQKSEVVEKMQKDQAAQASELEKNRLRKTALENELTTLRQDQATLQTWLAENERLAGLPADMPAIRVFRAQLGEVYKAKTAAETQRQTLENQLDTAGIFAAQVRLDLQAAETDLDNARQLFNRQAPEPYVASRQDLLEKLNKDIEALADEEKNFRQLQAFDREYRQTLEEMAEGRHELDLLELRQEVIDNQMLEITERKEELERIFHFKQAIFHQQQKIESYADDRATLEDGQACPLCFSTHHPFRAHFSKPFVSESKREFEAAKAALEQLEVEKQGLMKQNFDVESKHNHHEIHLSRLRQQAFEQERKFRDAFPFLPGDQPGGEHGGEFGEGVGGGWLAEKLAAFEQLLASQKAVRERLLGLHRQIEKLEKKAGDLAKQVREAEFELLQAEQSLKHNQQTLNGLQADFAAKNEDLNRLVEKYGYRFVLGETNGMFDELGKKEQDWLAKKNLQTDTERRLELTNQSLRQTASALAEAEKKFATQAAEAAAELEKLTDLKTRRHQLLGDKIVAQERAAFLSELEKKEQAFSAARSEVEKMRLEVSRCQLSLQSQLDRLAANQKVQADILADLDSRISKAGFGDLERLRSAVLPEEKAAQLVDLEAHLKSRETENRQAQQALEKELTGLRQAAAGTKNLEELQVESEALEENFQSAQQMIGRLKQQISEQDKLREEAENLSQQIEIQQKTTFRWVALSKLIGSSDGSKFRRFAQGLTLQKLVQLANLHLKSLSGRYRIRKRLGEDLELDIVDTYQAEHVRSMHSLSGGESFLVSLALALGLSDLAGRDANIRSLFIDEGFGTLDDQALDVAISTLENLQATGKTIGVISHVKELKERIAAQIKVVKKGGGVSVVEVV